MFYSTNKETLRRARELRNNPTEAEKMIWEILKKGKINGMKFRRQHPVGSFIADFYCHSQKLIVEVDGPIHSEEIQSEYDEGREAIIHSLGIKILRIKNEDIVNDIKSVEDQIRKKFTY